MSFALDERPMDSLAEVFDTPDCVYAKSQLIYELFHHKVENCPYPTLEKFWANASRGLTRGDILALVLGDLTGVKRRDYPRYREPWFDIGTLDRSFLQESDVFKFRHRADEPKEDYIVIANQLREDSYLFIAIKKNQLGLDNVTIL